MKFLFTTVTLLLFAAQFAIAQIDLQCGGRDKHSIYLIAGNTIFRIDSIDTNPSAPISLLSNSSVNAGISINLDLENGTGDTVMYGCNFTNTLYYKYSSSGWISTGHSKGGVDAVNFGGSDQYLFNIDGSAGGIFRYDGSTSSLLIGLPSFNVIADVAVDKNGNFYLLSTNDSTLTVYTPDGTLLQTFGVVVNNPDNQSTHGGGFAILGDNMYFIDVSTPRQYIYKGSMTNNLMTFDLIDSLPTGLFVDDIAACPYSAEPLLIPKVNDAAQFVVYPNPATNMLTVDLNNTATVTLTDCTGRQVFYKNTKGLTKINVPLNNFPAGIYFVAAASPSGTVKYRKLIVQ